MRWALWAALEFERRLSINTAQAPGLGDAVLFILGRGANGQLPREEAGGGRT